MARDPDIPPPRLYLITPPLAAAEPFLDALRAALAAGDVACVLARLATPDPGEKKKIARALGAATAQTDAALLIDGDPQLAARAGADGAHLDATDTEALDAAIAALKPDRIVGAGQLPTRDACMAAGERDVDYLMFGGPDDPSTAHDVRERAEWWAGIFNVPCVAYAHTLEDVEALARVGVEFVALERAVWADPRGPAAAVDAAAMALKTGTSP